MRKKSGLIFQYIIFLGAGIFLIWWQFSKMTAQEMTKFKLALSDADYTIVIPIILLSLASHVSRSARWKILMEPMGYNPSLFNTFGVTMVGYLANSFVPRLGEILKCTLLGKYEKIPVQKLIGTIVTERIFDLLCYLFFILITVIIQFNLVGDFVKESISALLKSNNGIGLWGRIIILLLIVVCIIFFVRFVFKKYGTSKLIIRLKVFFTGLKEGIASIKKLKKRGWFIFHTVFIWSMYLLQVYIGFWAIKEVSHLGLNAACAVLTLATFAIILTPGGIGTFPAAIFLVLSLYGIDQSTGEAFGWLMWGTTTFIILFFGLLSLALLYFNNKNKINADAADNPISTA